MRYAGLRLLERTGTSYYLISDGWTRTYGVLSIVPDDDAGVRVDLVRDDR